MVITEHKQYKQEYMNTKYDTHVAERNREEREEQREGRVGEEG